MLKAIEIYKVLICGDRNWDRSYTRILKREIRDLIDEHGTTKLLVISGGAPGVDSLAKKIAHSLNVHVAEIVPLWDKRHGAGPQRNKMMAALQPDEVIAVHKNISESKGTASMLDIARKRGIPNRLISS